MDVDYTTHFLRREVIGLVVSCLWLGTPGWLACRLVGFPRSVCLLLAPLLGAAVWGTFSCLLFHLLPYTPWSLFALFPLLVLFLTLLYRSYASGDTVDRAEGRRQWLSAWGVLLLALPLGGLASVDITPVVYEGGLFTGPAIYDHGKVAIVDALHRDGLPPVTPYYHPGRPVTLNYYYLWHFLASQVKMLAGCTGWQADASFTWFTLSAVLALVGGMVILLGGRFVGAAASVLLLTCGAGILGLVEVASPFRGHPLVRLIVPLIPEQLSIQTLVVNAMWAPQHVLAAGLVVLALLGLSRMACGVGSAVGSVVVVGVLAAGIFGTSGWIALSCVFALPWVAAAVGLFAWHQGITGRMRGQLPALLGVTAVTVLLSSPFLLVYLSGEEGVGEESGLGWPVVFELQSAAFSPSPWANFFLWWTKLLPAVYSVTLIFGILGLLAYRPRSDLRHLFRWSAAAAVPPFLLVSQSLKSTIGANDLGWRAHLPAYLLLAIFSGLAVSQLSGRPEKGKDALSVFLSRLPVRLGLAALGLAGLMLGLMAGPYRDALNTYLLKRPLPQLVETQVELRRGFLRQERAWELVRRYAGPTNIVQSNPDAYGALTPWPVNLPYMLFADRTSAVATPNTARVFAFRSDPDERARAISIVRAVFQGRPEHDAFEALRRSLGVDVVLVDRRDPVFNTSLLDDSPVWRRVHRDEDFSIYAAEDLSSTSELVNLSR